jgi:hypothetical protein
MKKNIWPTRNLYLRHVDPQQLKLHQPKPTRDEAVQLRRDKTRTAWDELQTRKKQLGDTSGTRATQTAMKQRKKRPGGGDWHLMNNDK